MKKRIIALIIVGCLLFLVSVCMAEDYVVGEGDVLMVSVWDNKDLTITVKVRPDGKITIPALGDVKAAGKSTQVLQDEVALKLKSLVKNPVVTVIVVEINNNKVFIFGGGTDIGVYSLNQRTTLLQLLCAVGGRAQSGGNSGDSGLKTADLTRSYLLRNGSVIAKDFRKLFYEGIIEEDMLLMPNDYLFIPSMMDRSVHVIGAVTTPKNVEYREGLTVMEAILDAGGFNKFANENSTVVYRKNGKTQTAMPIKLKQLINDGDLSQNIQLEAGDYVVVSEGIF